MRTETPSLSVASVSYCAWYARTWLGLGLGLGLGFGLRLGLGLGLGVGVGVGEGVGLGLGVGVGVCAHLVLIVGGRELALEGEEAEHLLERGRPHLAS